MNNIWHRITIDDPQLTRGDGLNNCLLETLHSGVLETAVIVTGVESGGDPEL